MQVVLRPGKSSVDATTVVVVGGAVVVVVVVVVVVGNSVGKFLYFCIFFKIHEASPIL